MFEIIGEIIVRFLQGIGAMVFRILWWLFIEALGSVFRFFWLRLFLRRQVTFGQVYFGMGRKQESFVKNYGWGLLIITIVLVAIGLCQKYKL
ncbi:MAG: hypothetical protein U0K29_06440 [Prevotella sp.]|nr:hypothetical protein [Prevotella sp.]